MIFFKAVKMNWSFHAFGYDWEEIVYEFEDNGRYKRTTKFTEEPDDRYPDKVYYGRFYSKKLEKLKSLLSRIQDVSAHIGGCEGEGWEMTLYGENGEVVYQTEGYIYGDELLEEIAAMMPNAGFQQHPEPETIRWKEEPPPDGPEFDGKGLSELAKGIIEDYDIHIRKVEDSYILYGDIIGSYGSLGALEEALEAMDC